MSILMRGMTGEPVRILQQKLGVSADGVFGAGTEAALREYQTNQGLKVDGIAGPDTFSAMELYELVLLHVGTKGDTVKKLQEALGVSADGIYGQGTAAAVKKFQEEQGLEADGIAGPATLARLPGFQMITEVHIETSVVTVNTQAIDPAALEAVRAEAPPPPEQQSMLAQVHATSPLAKAQELGAMVGKSIWGTIKSIF